MLRNRLIIALTLALIVAGASPTLAVRRVAPKWNLLEFRGGYGIPQGTYDRIVGTDFVFDGSERVSFDADRVYDNGFYFGLSYGRAMDNHWLFTIGFDYTRNRINNLIEQEIGNFIYTVSFPGQKLTLNQYDLSFKGAYQFGNFQASPISPFVGLGTALGLSSVAYANNYSETNFSMVASFDFGLDLKVWQAPDNRSYLTLSSINSWEFLASGDRARLLRVGGGLKYFFRP